MPRLVVGTLLLAIALPLTASAQPAGDLSLDTFRPAIDSRGYLTLNASQPLGHKEVSFGLGSLTWGHKLLKFEDGSNTYEVNDVVTATLVAAFGFHLGPLELEIAGSVPLSILSGDRGPDELGAPGDPNDDKDYKLDGQGLGNIGLHLKTRFIKSSRPPHVGVGVIASVFFPTTDPVERFIGEQKLNTQIIGIVDKEFGRRGRLRIALNGGIRFRPTTTFTDMGHMGAPPTNKTIEASAEVPLGLGIAYAISPQKFDVVGEVFGALPLGNHENYQPLEAIAGIKLYLARNSFLSLGAGRGLMPAKGANPDIRAFIGIVFEPNLGDRDGDGIKDDIDKCPDEPEDFDRFEDEDGCPEPDNDRDAIIDELDKCPNVPEDRDDFQDEDGCPEGNPNDRDSDGIVDKLDKCPDYPEDFDNFEDEDGCPDLDNDKDRITDKLDKCPNQPEEYNNFEDEDGCPDRHGARLTESGIITLEPINFEYNKAIIKKDSFYILDAVVASLQGNPDLSLLEIQGHTDERGDDAYNLDLSIRRAAAVLKYLTDKGVEASRLESQGYGETMPVDKRSNEQAWAKNRRVDFLILKRATK
ncbi:MAG: OmpA family protein [Deltaproteobacteria bacterium]|nr:OmpA family protein [Deltaproteobacteria bacterium]